MLWSLVAVLLALCGGASLRDPSPLEGGGHLPAGGVVCPDTWFVPSGPNGSCQCGHTFNGKVSCDEDTKEVRVLDCFCMTFDSTYNRTVLGECLFNCINVSKSYYDFIYHPVPRNLGRGDDNNSVCGYLNRQGRLCGECVDSHYLAAYSYTFDCIPCSKSQWLEYIVVAYAPLSVFIIFILVFRVNVVSPKLYGVISMLQTLASPLNIRVMEQAAKHDIVYKLVEAFLAMLSIWNLDFFRNIIQGVCLELNSLQILALDYLIAIYPMIVTVIAFLVLELHNRGFGPVLFVCRPFHRAFANFRRGWNLHTSLIDAFITFFVLSTTKLLHVSVSLLLSVTLHDAEANTFHHYWLEDASIQFFGPLHRPYAILALCVITSLIVLPVSLLVGYQFSCCQTCLRKTRLKGRVLEDFMHSFNQYYKDGSGGTRDCRWFAAFYILTRLGIYLLLFFPLSAIFYNLALVYVLVCAIVVLLIEPYRDQYQFHNHLEPCVFLSLAFIMAGVSGVNIGNLESRDYVPGMFMFTALVAMVPMVYLSIVTVRWVLQRNPCGFRVARRTEDPDLPHRLLHSGSSSWHSESYSSSHDSRSQYGSYGDDSASLSRPY